MITKRQWAARVLAGGFVGLAVLIPLGGLVNDLVSGGLVAMGFHTPFRLVSSELAWLTGADTPALIIQLALYFALGAGGGAATLPFAEDGMLLVRHSLLHFAYTAAVFSILVWLCGWNWGSWSVWLAELALLAGAYLVIWLARWLFWYAELRRIRSALGLKRKERKPL